MNGFTACPRLDNGDDMACARNAKSGFAAVSLGQIMDATKKFSDMLPSSSVMCCNERFPSTYTTRKYTRLWAVHTACGRTRGRGAQTLTVRDANGRISRHRQLLLECLAKSRDPDVLPAAICLAAVRRDPKRHIVWGHPVAQRVDDEFGLRVKPRVSESAARGGFTCHTSVSCPRNPEGRGVVVPSRGTPAMPR